MSLDDDLSAVFEWDMVNHPRTLQEAIGPSEIGDPCARKLAYKVAGVPGSGGGTAFPSWIGTQAHSGAEKAFQAHNERLGRERWITESKVSVGKMLDLQVGGTCDLYDTDTESVIDFKFVGATKLRDYRANGLSDVYRTQIHGYGQGMANAGRDVERVGVFLLPRDGRLRDATLLIEDFDPAVVRRALRRMEGIVSAVRTHGVDAIGTFPMAESYCLYCPWFVKGATDPRTGCPGVAPAWRSKNSEPLTFSV